MFGWNWFWLILGGFVAFIFLVNLVTPDDKKTARLKKKRKAYKALKKWVDGGGDAMTEAQSKIAKYYDIDDFSATASIDLPGYNEVFRGEEVYVDHIMVAGDTLWINISAYAEFNDCHFEADIKASRFKSISIDGKRKSGKTLQNFFRKQFEKAEKLEEDERLLEEEELRDEEEA